MKGFVYDCEIIRCIPPKGLEMLTMEPGKEAYFNRFGDGYQYCSGWDDFEDMGISMICAVDLASDQSWVFVESNFTDFKNLIASTEQNGLTIAGFNSIKFDDNLCKANGIEITTTFDLLLAVRVSAYGSPDWEDQPKGYSYSLDKIARANGLAKIGHGELAPKLWQQGKYQEVIDYCLNDVIITKQLILKYLADELIDPNTQEVLKCTIHNAKS